MDHGGGTAGAKRGLMPSNSMFAPSNWWEVVWSENNDYLLLRTRQADPLPLAALLCHICLVLSRTRWAWARWAWASKRAGRQAGIHISCDTDARGQRGERCRRTLSAWYPLIIYHLDKRETRRRLVGDGGGGSGEGIGPDAPCKCKWRERECV